MATKGTNSDFPDKDTLRKYLQGKLSPDESHRLEKLILNNPFYQEALEGIESIGEQELEQDLNDLSGQISKKAQLQKKRSSFNLYRVAAAIILLASFSYIIIYTTTRIEEVSNNKTLSQKQDAVVEEGKEHAEAPETGEEDPDKSSDGEETETRQSDIGAAPGKADQPVQILNEPERLTETAEEIIQDARKRSEQVVVNPDFIEPEPLEPEEELLERDIPKEQKVEYALTIENDSDGRKAEQDKGFGEEQENLAIIEEEDNLNIQSNQEKIPTEELEPESERNLAESAPVSNDFSQATGRSRKESKLARQSESQSTEPMSTATAPLSISEKSAEIILKPVPVNGYEDYSEYIEENLNYPERRGDKRIEGIVRLQFIINKDSLPDKIQVIQSLGPDFDKEAIRLLQEGPGWIPVYKNGDFVEVEVEYNISFYPDE